MNAPACARTDCASGKDPVWCPVLLLCARPGQEPARARLDIRLCDDCRDRAHTSDFLSDAGWARVLKKWPLKHSFPKMELTGLDFDLIELDEDPLDNQ